MEIWDAIRSRRNVRAYENRPIPAEALERILEAARRSPSSMNTQPWDFVVCTDPERLNRLARVWAHGTHVASSAATIALIAPADEESRNSVKYDLGQATMSMLLAATDLGIGCGHSGVQDQALAREILGFPADRYCAYLIALGYPADRPLRPIDRPNRRSLDDVVHRETW